MLAPSSPQSILAPGRLSQAGEPTWEIACMYPTQGNWTVAEYLALDTNWLVEYTDGYVEFLPMPTLFHQLVVKYLARLLDEFVSRHAKGTVAFAPLPITLATTRYREPDIVYLSPERIKDPHGQPEGADLVMEIVSAGKENRERDLVDKPKVYAAAGISEYWIVDPEQRQIQVLTLDGKEYRVHGCFNAGVADSVRLPGFTVNVADVWAAGERV